MEGYFIGQIILFGGTFSAISTVSCEGQLLDISQYSALFSLIGTTYGGNGQTTFAVPDMRGRIPVGQGTGPGLSTKVIGEQSGALSHTLTTNEMPSHNHLVTPKVSVSSNSANSTNPNNQVLANTSTSFYENVNAKDSNLGGVTASLAATAGNQPLNLGMPYLGLRFLLFVEGIYPSRN